LASLDTQLQTWISLLGNSAVTDFEVVPESQPTVNSGARKGPKIYLGMDTQGAPKTFRTFVLAHEYAHLLFYPNLSKVFNRRVVGRKLCDYDELFADTFATFLTKMSDVYFRDQDDDSHHFEFVPVRQSLWNLYIKDAKPEQLEIFIKTFMDAVSDHVRSRAKGPLSQAEIELSDYDREKMNNDFLQIFANRAMQNGFSSVGLLGR
jgi:hypothetical protein